MGYRIFSEFGNDFGNKAVVLPQTLLIPNDLAEEVAAINNISWDKVRQDNIAAPHYLYISSEYIQHQTILFSTIESHIFG